MRNARRVPHKGIYKKPMTFFKVNNMRNPKFKEILDKMLEIHEAKNHDYAGDGGDPYKNFRECEDIYVEGNPIPAWTGILVRIGDKWSRIKNLTKFEPAVKGESIKDTLLDMANYSVLALIVLEELEEKGKRNLIKC